MNESPLSCKPGLHLVRVHGEGNVYRSEDHRSPFCSCALEDDERYEREVEWNNVIQPAYKAIASAFGTQFGLDVLAYFKVSRVGGNPFFESAAIVVPKNLRELFHNGRKIS